MAGDDPALIRSHPRHTDAARARKGLPERALPQTRGPGGGSSEGLVSCPRKAAGAVAVRSVVTVWALWERPGRRRSAVRGWLGSVHTRRTSRTTRHVRELHSPQ